ncbi:MAG: radical SAM protein [Anaerolineae bacterium]|nr:radical SAM protein [Anaerolineae bacterium]
MFDLLPRIPSYVMFRKRGRPHLLPLNLTISPSVRCNSRCRTCNIWKKQEDELSIQEWDRVLKSLDQAPYWVTISGGEPFLYPHLVELAQLLYHHCKPRIINIPHNGLLDKIAPQKVAAIAKACPEAEIIINLSLDGVGEQHDSIRGVPGNFRHFERTYRALRELKLENLTVGVHTVISRLNVHDIEPVFDYVLSLAPDSYVSEVAEKRVELDTIDLDITPSAGEYAAAIDALNARLQTRELHRVSQLTAAIRARYYELVVRTLEEETQVIPCYAGWASAQISSSGDVWPCCVRADKIANLRDIDYDFGRAWFSPAADRVRNSIRRQECFCPLANAYYTSMMCHLASLSAIGWSYLKNRLFPHNRRRSARQANG